MPITRKINACPITRESVDAHAARLVAGLAAVLVGIALVADLPWLSLCLAVDFGLRGWGKASLSPLGQAARAGLRALGVAGKRTDAGPKRFAAKLGMGLAGAVTVALLLRQNTLALGLGSSLLGCAVLEAGLGLCLGCWVYQWLPGRAGVDAVATR